VYKSPEAVSKMKFKTQGLVANLQQYWTKLVGGLLILTLVWQGAILGVNPATASTLLATSADSISKQVSGKAQEVKGGATNSMGKVQSAIEDKLSDGKMKAKDDLTETKNVVNNNAARAENAAEKASEKVKNFFGK
jgi:hypothetical protein